MATKLNIQHVANKLRKEGYSLLSTEYVNNKTPLTFQCPQGHIFSRPFVFWSSGKRCPVCRRPNRYKTQSDFHREITKEGYKIRVHSWNQKRLKDIRADLTCPEGHTYPFNVFRWSIGQRCRICRYTTSGSYIKKSLKEIKVALASVGYTLLTNSYKDNRSPLCVRCDKGHTYETCWNNFQRNSRCPVCGASGQERDLISFIKTTYDGDLRFHDRSILDGREVDVFIPEFNLAVEYHGLRWHCESLGGKKRRYHLDKTLNCARKGVRLIQIFEDEWIFKRKIVESKLRNLLRRNTQKIHGRKCEIRPIRSLTATAFLNEHHLQGTHRSVVSYGALYKDELVAVMTFSRPSIAKGACKKYDWELDKFASKKDFIVHGIANRLFRAFVNEFNPQNVVTYADRRWSTGEVYHKMGFKHIRDTGPNYWYIKTTGNRFPVRLHRFGFRKSMIRSRFPLHFVLQDTEFQNMLRVGYDRIWDCGNSVFLFGETLGN